MKILFVCDYFPPFVKGGGEISSYWQVRKATREGIEIIVLAPRYRDKLKIKKEEFKRYWYYLPFKLNVTSPIIFLNPLFLIYLFYQIIKVAKKEKIHLIHCQGKYSTPSVVLAKIFLKIPAILTLRDYKGVCNLGFCLWNGKKSCNLLSFFKKDFLFYYKNYVKNKNLASFLAQLIVSYIGRLNTILLSFFMKRTDKLVCVSDYIAKVYANNGYDKKKMITIYNLAPNLERKDIKIPKNFERAMKKFKYIILYAGKLSLGKGANLFITVAQEIVKKRKDVLFIFAGKTFYPIKKANSKQLLFLDRVNHQLLLKIMGLSDLVCVSSIWPEPLSRVTLEAFSLGKPVLSSNVGGQKELVSNKTGWLFNPTKKELIKTINNALKNKNKWHILGENGKEFLLDLEKEQINKLISLYKLIMSR